MKTMNWKLIAFLILSLGMLFVAAEKIIQAEIALRHGTSFRCRIRGFDPADPLRGRYLEFIMPDEAQQKNDNNIPWGIPVFVTMGTDKDGLAVFQAISRTRPDREPYLQVRAGNSWGDKAQFEPPFRRYYVNERQAREAERIMQEAQAKNDCYLQFKVYRGFAVIEDILIGNQPLSKLLKQQ